MQMKILKFPVTRATAMEHFASQVDTSCKYIAVPAIEVAQEPFSL